MVHCCMFLTVLMSRMRKQQSGSADRDRFVYSDVCVVTRICGDVYLFVPVRLLWCCEAAMWFNWYEVLSCELLV